MEVAGQKAAEAAEVLYKLIFAGKSLDGAEMRNPKKKAKIKGG